MHALSKVERRAHWPQRLLLTGSIALLVGLVGLLLAFHPPMASMAHLPRMICLAIPESPVDLGNPAAAPGAIPLPGRAILQSLVPAGLVTLESAEIPLTDFVTTDLVPYRELSGRLIAEDPRASALLGAWPDFFRRNFDGRSWRLVYLPAAALPELRNLTDAFSAVNLEWRHNIDFSATVWPVWLALVLFQILVLLSTRRARDSLFRVGLALPWLAGAVIDGGLPGAVLSLIVLAGQAGFCTAFPPTLNGRGRLTFHGAGLKPVLFLLWPYAALSLGLLIAVPRLVIWYLLAALVTGLLVRFGTGLYQVDHWRVIHKPPLFHRILPTASRVRRHTAFWPSLVAGLLVLVLSLVGTAPVYQANYALELGDALESQQLERGLLEHAFLQLALQDGILGSLDLAAGRYRRYASTLAENGSSSIAFQDVHLAEVRDQLGVLIRQGNLRLLLPETGPAWSPSQESQPQSAQMSRFGLDAIPYYICILGLVLLVAFEVLTASRAIRQSSDRGR